MSEGGGAGSVASGRFSPRALPPGLPLGRRRRRPHRVRLGDRLGWRSYGGSVSVLRVVVLGPLTLAIIGPILVVERVRPAQRRPLVARGHRQDVLYTLLNVTLVVPLVTALTLSFAELITRAFPWLVLPRMGWCPAGSPWP